MNTRQTSIDCYNQIKAEGLLSKLRFRVYEWLYNNGPATAQEVTTGLANGSQDHGSFSTRLSELRDHGVVKECGLVNSKTTGRTVILWDVTSNLPVKPPNTRSTKTERVFNALNALRELYKTKNTSTDDDWINVADLINGI